VVQEVKPEADGEGWLGVAAAIGWLLMAALLYSVAREPGSER
jgi:hypothetical protein